MGIDTDGGMIVGAIGTELFKCAPEEVPFYEWAEENELERMSMHYDADCDWCYYGYIVDDVMVSEMDGEWLADVKAKAKKFEALTGVPAQLIGTQDVT